MIGLSLILGSFVVFVCLGFILQRSNQAQLSQGFKLLQETVEGTNRSLLHAQKEFENTYEQRNASLRIELQEGLQNSRKEVQSGLANTTVVLEQKVSQIDQRLD